MKSKGLAIIFCAFALFYNAPDVFACDCSLPEKIKDETAFREMVVNKYNKAVAVFSGEITDNDKFNIKFKIEKNWKGATGASYAMSTGLRPSGSGTFKSSSCDYSFNDGDKYLVFAFKTQYGDVQTYYCSLTQPLGKAERTEKTLDEFIKEQKMNSKSFEENFGLAFSWHYLNYIL